MVRGLWFMGYGRRKEMASIQRFEEIEAWQKARELTHLIYACSKQGPFAKDFALRDQIRRSAISVMSNIAEGFERSGKGEFIQFLAIAKGSVAEVEAQLYVAFDEEYINKEKFKELQEVARSTTRLLGGFMKYLKNTDLRGLKYK
jgi:four helix bundle protein